MVSASKFSVVIPLYNKAEYVRDAILSVLNQTVQVAEIIIIDDGSIDNGDAIVKEFKDSRIRLLTQSNKGVSIARNHGLELASFDFVSFLDADDFYNPTFVQEVLDLAEKFPAADILCGGYTVYSDDGTKGECVSPYAVPNNSLLIDDFYKWWAKGSFTCTCSMAFRRLLFDNPDFRFPAGEKLGEDQDLWFRIAEKHLFAYVCKPLVNYRIGVVGSATQLGPIVDILPCYYRLNKRINSGIVPPLMRRSARKLYSSHILNVARANAISGNFHKSWRLLGSHEVLFNFPYFLRTCIALVLAVLRFRFRGRV